MLHEQMNRFFYGLPPRRASDGGVRGRRRGARRPSTTTRLDINDPCPARYPTRSAGREDADHRSDGLQVFRGPALYLSEERPRLLPPTSCTWCFAIPCEDYEVDPATLAGDRPAAASSTPITSKTPRRPRSAWSARRARTPSPASPPVSLACGGPPMAGRIRRRSRCWSDIGSGRPHSAVRPTPAKDKNENFRLIGFGHRVYKNYDPRARDHAAGPAQEVLDNLGIKDDPQLQIAMALERIALEDDYFVEKKLYPNVDFYSGITPRRSGFPTSMFTVLFPLARTPAGSRNGSKCSSIRSNALAVRASSTPERRRARTFRSATAELSHRPRGRSRSPRDRPAVAKKPPVGPSSGRSTAQSTLAAPSETGRPPAPPMSVAAQPGVSMERMLAQRQADRAHRKARSTVLSGRSARHAARGAGDRPRQGRRYLTSPQTKNRLM